MNPLSILTQLRIWWSYKASTFFLNMEGAIMNDDLDAVLYFGLKIKDGPESKINLGHALHYAAKSGHPDSIRALIELGTNVYTTDKFGRTPLHHAAKSGHPDSTRALIELGTNVNTTDNFGNTPIFGAVMFRHSDSIQALIELGANVDITNNYGQTLLHLTARQGEINSMLILTARGGNLETINNRGLTPLQQLAHNGREALEDFLTQANLLDRYDVDEIMEGVQVDAQVGVQGLRAQAQNQESSMQRLSNAEESNLKHIKEHYKQQFTQQGQATIWDNLKQHLEYEYQKNPAKNSNDQTLPLAFDATKEREPYYKHPAHTAWRYLFQAPNPWMTPDAYWVSERSANINPTDKESIAYLWLAASDKSITPIDDVSLADRIDFFINALALLGRSHNWDKINNKGEEYDDMEGDKPSCSMGVSKRLAQSIIGHPIAQKDNSEKLTATILQKIFCEQVVSENNSDSNNDNAKWTIHSRLQDLNYETLVALKEALEDKVIMLSATVDQESILQEYLNVPDDAANQFISYLERKFGQSKMQDDKRIHFQACVFDNYKALAHHMAQHAGEIFYKHLSGMMDNFIKEKTPDQDMADNNNNNIVTTPQYNLHSRRRKENERGDNNEENAQLEPPKKRSETNNNNNL